MKKYLTLIIVILLTFICNITYVSAHEMYSDGWHLVSSNLENSQKKEWAYYKNGVEEKRYSRLYGAHRGWGDAPENSLAAFKLAKDHGFVAFETDVRFTKDSVAVLCHDDNINSLARNNDLSEISNRISIKELTYKELKNNYVFPIERLNYGSNRVVSGYEKNRITTFEEMLDFVKTNGMHVSIELKAGTKDEISSIVKMAKDKGMHDYIIWISYSTDLLKYVTEFDNDEYIYVLADASSECNPNQNNIYCLNTGDYNYFYNKLKTNNNLVWISPLISKQNLPVFNVGINLPARSSEISATSYQSKTIPQGKITIDNKVTINDNDSSISYKYNGDGTVKCSGSKNITCSVDEKNKKILLKVDNNYSKGEKIKVYATQGISYSASIDSMVEVEYITTKKEESIVVKANSDVSKVTTSTNDVVNVSNVTIVSVPDTGNNISIIIYIISFILIGSVFIYIKRYQK